MLASRRAHREGSPILLDALTLFRYELAQSHRILDLVVRDLAGDQLDYKVPGGTINPIAAIYMHAVFSEDNFIHRVCQSRPPLFEAEGWLDRLGLPYSGLQTPAWAEGIHITLHVAREYAREVYDDTEAYLATLPPAAFDGMIDTRLGRKPLGEALASFLLWHQMGHVGEIAALKGVQGLQGWPF